MGKITQLTCPNCKHTEDIENMNFRKNSKMYMAKLYLQQKQNPELEIYTFICFSCNHLTNFAGKIVGDVEYFQIFIIFFNRFFIFCNCFITTFNFFY